MKAALLHAYKQPLRIEEVPAPVPGPGEVLVRVEACGVCHSDIHLADGDWDMLKTIVKLPLILGHEVAGTVAAVGEGVDGFSNGDRVGVPWIHWTCGECEYCLIGRETLCLKQRITGATVDGGYAEYLTAKATHVARIPSVLNAEEAAPLMCAGLTVFKALKSSGIRPGERLAVFGIGGLGHLAVQIARKMGVEVCAVDISEDKLHLAQEYGAQWTIDATSAQAHKQAKAFGGVHVAMVTSASRAAYESAMRFLRRGGTLAVVGMSEPFTVSPVAMVSGETRIIASAVGTREDLRELLDLAAGGGVRCRVESRPLDDADEVFREIKRGAVLGRVVLKP